MCGNLGIFSIVYENLAFCMKWTFLSGNIYENGIYFIYEMLLVTALVNTYFVTAELPVFN